MSLYAESSAVLAWLLDEPAATVVRQTLPASEIELTSDLTLIECDRVLHRAAAPGFGPSAPFTWRRCSWRARPSQDSNF